MPSLANPHVIGRLLIVLLALLLAGPARADVHDEAHLFGPQALNDADTVTDQMARQYGKQLVVETFGAVPPRRRAEVDKDKAGFFKGWMVSRAKVLEVNGVYVLICMDPKYVEVGAGAQTRANGIFTAQDVVRLRQQLQADLRGRRYDAALTGVVRQVADTYAANIPGARPLDVPPPVPQPEPTTAPASTTMPAATTKGLATTRPAG